MVLNSLAMRVDAQVPEHAIPLEMLSRGDDTPLLPERRPQYARRRNKRSCGTGTGYYLLQGGYIALSWLWRGLQFLAVGIVISFLILFILALAFGSASASGAVWMLIGNAILRNHHPGYTESNKIAATIGAAGFMFATISVSLILKLVPWTAFDKETGDGEHSLLVRASAIVGTGALTGAIGAYILHLRTINLQGLDILHSCRAGALGATILVIPSLFVVPTIFFVVSIITFPLLLMMYKGLEFMHVTTTEVISEAGLERYTSVVCLGTCTGDDEEIQDEFAYRAV